MHETRNILDYETPLKTPLPADEEFSGPRPPVPVPVMLRRIAVVVSLILLLAGIWHVANHQTDGRIELIYGGLLAVFANPFRRLGKENALSTSQQRC